MREIAKTESTSKILESLNMFKIFDKRMLSGRWRARLLTLDNKRNRAVTAMFDTVKVQNE